MYLFSEYRIGLLAFFSSMNLTGVNLASEEIAKGFLSSSVEISEFFRFLFLEISEMTSSSPSKFSVELDIVEESDEIDLAVDM